MCALGGVLAASTATAAACDEHTVFECVTALPQVARATTSAACNHRTPTTGMPPWRATVVPSDGVFHTAATNPGD